MTDTKDDHYANIMILKQTRPQICHKSYLRLCISIRLQATRSCSQSKGAKGTAKEKLFTLSVYRVFCEIENCSIIYVKKE